MAECPAPVEAIAECGACEHFVEMLVELRTPHDASLSELRELAAEFYYRPPHLRRVRGTVVWNGCEECP